MNLQMQASYRQLYRRVEEGIKHAVNHIAEENLPIEPDTLRKVLIERDGEVQSAVGVLIDSILEDISDHKRIDAFTDEDEKRERIGLDIIADNPELLFEEKELAEQISESDDFYKLTVEEGKKEALEMVYSKRFRDRAEDMLSDMADLRDMRKDPHHYHGASEKNIVGVE